MGFASDILAGYRQRKAARARYRKTYRELSAMTNSELADIGLHRVQIEDVARAASHQE